MQARLHCVWHCVLDLPVSRHSSIQSAMHPARPGPSKMTAGSTQFCERLSESAKAAVNPGKCMICPPLRGVDMVLIDIPGIIRNLSSSRAPAITSSLRMGL